MGVTCRSVVGWESMLAEGDDVTGIVIESRSVEG